MKIIIDVDKLNDADSIDELIKKSENEIICGIDACEYADFLITDNRRAADIAITRGIGISVYINGMNDASDFPEALYCIDSLYDMSDETLLRMYQRANNIPWTILETKRCVVREITLADIDRLYEVYSDPLVKKYIEDLYEDKEEEIRFTKDYIENQYKFYEYGLWVVLLKDTNELIGRAGIFGREDQEELEIGFVFKRAYWGVGISDEVLTAIIDYAKEELSVNVLVAHAEKGNEHSRRFLTRLGFKYIGDCEGEKTFETFEKTL